MLFCNIFDTTQTLGVFLFTLIVCCVIYRWICNRNYPPGPAGLPFIGYGIFLGKKPMLTLQRLGKKYDGIFSLYIGRQLIVFVTEYRIFKHIYSLPNILARPSNSSPAVTGGFGILNGKDWKEQRRYAMHILRNLGLGKGPWETMIKRDATEFVKEIGTRTGKPVYFEKLLSRSLIINLLSLLFGRHLDPEAEKEDIEMVYTFGKAFLNYLVLAKMNVICPLLFKILQKFNFRGLKDFKRLGRTCEDFIKKEVEKRIDSKNEMEIRSDFINYYLEEIDKRKNEVNTSFTVNNLIGSIFTFIIAGHDSTVMSISKMLLLMAKYQDVQKRICEEIDREIGRDGTVNFDDKLKLPYTMASILEMLRGISKNGTLPPRFVTESFTFGKYEIPQGAWIIGHSYAIMHDPEYFESPMEYEPKNFLDSDGSVRLNNVDAFVPFSLGKRNCPGDNVALMTIYLYFVTIMQRFSIKHALGKEPDLDYALETAEILNPSELCFIER